VSRGSVVGGVAGARIGMDANLRWLWLRFGAGKDADSAITGAWLAQDDYEVRPSPSKGGLLETMP